MHAVIHDGNLMNDIKDKEDITRILDNAMFWKDIKDIHDLIKPIALATISLQKNTSVSAVFFEISGLLTHYKEIDDDEQKNMDMNDENNAFYVPVFVNWIIKIINHYWDMIAKNTNAHAGSALMFRNVEFNGEDGDREDGLNYLKGLYNWLEGNDNAWDSIGYNQWLAFYHNGEEFCRGKCDGLNLNNVIKTTALFKEFETFSKLGEICKMLPTGIAGVERSFSMVNAIHCTGRASLGPETLNKLCFIYFNKDIC